MSKKQKNQMNSLEDFISTFYTAPHLLQPKQTNSYGNTLQQAKADGLLHEQECMMQRASDVLYLALELQKVQKELQKTKKFMDEMTLYVSSLNMNCHKMDKKVQKLSDQVTALHKHTLSQKKKSKKYYSQIRRQKKIICLMGTYIGINNPADNLEKVLSKCSKKLDVTFTKKALPIIDVTCREVTK